MILNHLNSLVLYSASFYIKAGLGLQRSRDFIELWISSRSDEYMQLVLTRSNPILESFYRVIHFYILDVLLKMNDWVSAKDFVEFNEFMTLDQKDVRNLYKFRCSDNLRFIVVLCQSN
jgi:hypothetical protein